MSDKDFDVRAEIMKSISATDDSKDRSMLMLMLGVLERVEQLLTDDEAMRKRVLNGNYAQHSDDHAWLTELRVKMDGMEEVCAYSRARMRRETDRSGRVRRLVDRALEHAVTVSLTATALYLGFIK